MRAHQLISALQGNEEVCVPAFYSKNTDEIEKEALALHEKYKRKELSSILAQEGLRDLKNDFIKRKIRFGDPVYEYAQRFCVTISRSQKFLFNDTNLIQLEDDKVIKECLNLPAPESYFEEEVAGKDKSVVCCLLATSKKDETCKPDVLWSAAAFLKVCGVWNLLGVMVECCVSEEGKFSLREVHSVGTQQVDIDIAMLFAKDVVFFLHTLACKNIDVEEVKADPKLVKARNKAGKIPPYSYHIVRLPYDKQKEYKDEIATLTHRSPRLHFRRGHIRHYDDGSLTWVTHCMVGRKEQGIIEKHYEAKNSLDTPLKPT